MMFDILRGLRMILKPRDKWQFCGLIFLLCLGAVMEIAGLGLILPLVAAFSKPELLEQNAILRFYRQLFWGVDERGFLLITCGLIIALYIFKNLWLFVIMRCYTSFIYSRFSDITCRIYFNCLRSGYLKFADNGKVELNALVAKVEYMSSLVLLPVMHITVDVLTIVFISGMLLFTIPGLVLGCVAVLGGCSCLILWVMRGINRSTGESYQKVIPEIQKIALYSFEDIKSVKVMGLEEYFLKMFSRPRQEKSRCETNLYMLGQVPRLVLESCSVMAALIMLIVMLLNGKPVGTVILSFSLLIAAMARLLPSISRINYSTSNIRGGYPIFKELIDTFQWEQEELGSLDEIFEFKESIRADNISFAYPESKKSIIDGLSFELKRNESLAIVGPTGGGKSTLVDLLLGLLMPQKGKITVDGKDIRTSLGAWRRLIGFVPQMIVLADDSIAANIALGHCRTEIDRDRVREVLRVAQLDGFVDSLPEGMDTVIGDNGIRLSGGQRQRIGIARALYRDPEIIIFDEATSALDYDTEKALMDAVEQLHGQKTIIMVAHRLSTVEKCDRRLEINPGRNPEQDNG